MTIYNEIEPFAAEWMRNLIAGGHIAPGVVDERSIVDLRATDVAGPGQRHFFAGIGGWSYALRLAGVPDDADVWTGSCPCQPFSAAGKRGGLDDARHLWPEWFRLIAECRPAIVLGEQVASADGLAWLDAVSTDLEGAGYAVGAADLCAAGVGAPHIRQRLYFVAYADGARPQGRGKRRHGADQRRARSGGVAGGMAHSDGIARGQGREIYGGSDSRGGAESRTGLGRGGEPRGMADADARGRVELGLGGVRQDGDAQPGTDADGRIAAGRVGDPDGLAAGRQRRGVPRAQAASGRGRIDHGPVDAGSHMDPWRGAEQFPCLDGRSRPIPAQPALFPLAARLPNRVGSLRGSGNAIVPQVAAAFVTASLEAIGDTP